MESKVLKVSKENYIWLLELASDIQKEKGRPVSFDEALSELKNRKMKKNNLLSLAGSWEMEDNEWDSIHKNLKREWKKWKIKSA